MTSSLFANKNRYIVNFANAYYAEYKRMKHGIANCRTSGKLWLDQLRFDLIQYGGDLDFCSQCVEVDLSKVKIDFPSGAGACCNVLPQGKNYVYTQDCNNPQAVWTIIHNLGFVPNVFIEDCTGCDIEGVVTVIDNNSLVITFTQPVAGKAYLS